MDVQHTGSMAVIIPVRNGVHYLPDCLAALDKQQGVDFDIYAVDNDSTDGSGAYIRDNWPNVRLLHSESPLGFAHACNLALDAAKEHSILVLLHQDTEVFPDWLSRLVAPLQRDRSIGITGSKAIYPNGTIQHAGGRVDARGARRLIGRGEPDRGQFDIRRQVQFVQSASLAISAEAYEQVGDLDECFTPGHYADTDWCYRVRSAGYGVTYVPDSRLIHKERDTQLDDTPGSAAESVYALHRNRLRFVLKHWSLHALVDDFMPAEQRWLDGLGKRRGQFLAVMHSAYMHQLAHLGEFVQARGSAYPADAEETDGFAAILLGLRALYPMQPSNGDDKQSLPLQHAPASQDNQSRPGRFARVRNSFRRGLARTARTGLLSPAARPLIELNHQQELANVLAEYICATGKEITQLSQESDMLRSHIQPGRDGTA